MTSEAAGPTVHTRVALATPERQAGTAEAIERTIAEKDTEAYSEPPSSSRLEGLSDGFGRSSTHTGRMATMLDWGDLLDLHLLGTRTAPGVSSMCEADREQVTRVVANLPDRAAGGTDDMVGLTEDVDN
ncbi:hypothetical protein SEPCBS57363_005304 [Sporothrix epigloea]|uniref:Uncharacterized protein n=1 Tax=Sporothrix epigloea TaxID=1892477 RepID=A0ABP0DWS1_9PEZI